MKSYLRKFWFGEPVVLSYSEGRIALEAVDYEHDIQFVIYENVVIDLLEDPTSITSIITSIIHMLEKLEQREATIYDVIKLVDRHINRQLERLSWL